MTKVSLSLSFWSKPGPRGKYCGNQTRVPPVLQSLGHELTLQFKTDSSIAHGGFRAVTRFTWGASRGCGGLVNVTEGSQTINSLDVNSDGR